MYILTETFSLSGAVAEALGSLVTDVQGMATSAAPVVLGAVAVLTGISIGINLFKRFAYSVA